jgi:hypothetical protein
MPPLVKMGHCWYHIICKRRHWRKTETLLLAHLQMPLEENRDITDNTLSANAAISENENNTGCTLSAKCRRV